MNTYPKATFERTVDILVKAYLNDTLEHQNCAACAVGNIIASNLNAVPAKARDLGYQCDISVWVRNGVRIEPLWQRVFCSDISGTKQRFSKSEYKGYAKMQIDMTGYTPKQLAKIEKSFESKVWSDDPMFDGLMAVVDVLAEIHGIDLTEKESAKALFVKA